MRKVKNAAVYIVLILASLISVFPLYWMIAAATNNSTDILGGKLTIGANLASNLTNLFQFYVLFGNFKCAFPADLFHCRICI